MQLETVDGLRLVGDEAFLALHCVEVKLRVVLDPLEEDLLLGVFMDVMVLFLVYKLLDTRVLLQSSAALGDSQACSDELCSGFINKLTFALFAVAQVESLDGLLFIDVLL